MLFRRFRFLEWFKCVAPPNLAKFNLPLALFRHLPYRPQIHDDPDDRGFVCLQFIHQVSGDPVRTDRGQLVF